VLWLLCVSEHQRRNAAFGRCSEPQRMKAIKAIYDTAHLGMSHFPKIIGAKN
jgi:hypothetical protein